MRLPLTSLIACQLCALSFVFTQTIVSTFCTHWRFRAVVNFSAVSTSEAGCPITKSGQLTEDECSLLVVLTANYPTILECEDIAPDSVHWKPKVHSSAWKCHWCQAEWFLFWTELSRTSDRRRACRFANSNLLSLNGLGHSSGPLAILDCSSAFHSLHYVLP